MLPILNRTHSIPSLIDEFLNSDLWPITEASRNYYKVPAVNISENEKDYRIEVAAPGMKKDDFKVDLDDNVLTISSEIENKKEEKKDNYVRREFSFNSFKRSFILPDSVETEKIGATYTDGVLHITVPKSEETKKITRNIKIA